tara:strand:+ start:209 stop:604 length:396 start_codon:yes stop_codon:yes gene_type:complete
MSDLEKIIYILNLSETHSIYKVSELVGIVLPPLRLKQYLLLTGQDILFFATWAFMSQEASDSFENRTRKLEDKDWNSGHIPWIIDIVSPLGNTTKGIKELKKIPRLLGVKGKIKFHRLKEGKRRLHSVTWL